MLNGWKKFSKEKPMTKKPFAYFSGEAGVLKEKDGMWEAHFTFYGQKVCVPAEFFYGLLFMDDLK